MKDMTPIDWLCSKRRSRSVKVICGIRGVGKTKALAAWRDELVREGVSEDRIVSVNVEDPTLRRLVTADDILRFLSTQIPSSGPVVLLLEEPTSFHDYEYVLGELLGQRRLDIYLTLSSRRLSKEGLSDYLRGAIALYEIMPPPGGIVESPEASRARWNEILLRDVLSAQGVADGNIAERLAAYLADNVDDPITLRQAAAAISPRGKQLSPNTIEAYLSALEDAYVIERCYLWDADSEEPVKRNCRVYFTDPALCFSCFGIVPDFERRLARNTEWLTLRRSHPRVYLSSEPPHAFVCPGV